MSGRPIKKATLNVSSVVRIVDSTTFLPELSVVATTPGLAFEYRREGAAEVSITTLNNLAALTTAHTDGGILHIGDGYYRIDYQDLAFATGSDGVLLHGTADGMVVIGTYHPLTDLDVYKFQQQTSKLLHITDGELIYVSTSGDDNNTAPYSWDNAKLTLAAGSGAVSVAVANDKIIMGPGTFAEGANQINIPDDVDLQGAGPHKTIITSDVIETTGACMTPGSRSIIEDITVRGKHTWAADRSDWTGIASGDNQAAFGIARAGDGNCEEVICRRCVFEGTLDAVKFDDASADDRQTARFEDCHFYSGFDCLGLARAGDVEFYRCRLEANANWGDEASLVGAISQAVSCAALSNPEFESTVLLVNCILIARNATTRNVALNISAITSGGARITAINSSLRAKGNGAEDIRVDNKGIIAVQNCYYDPAKVSVSGTGIFEVGQARLDLEQALDLTPTTDTVGDPLFAAARGLPTAAPATSGGLLTFGSGAGQINTDGAGRPDVNVERWLDGTPNALNTGSIQADLQRWINVVPLGLTAQRVETNVGAMEAGVIASGVIAAAELTNIENEVWDGLTSAHVTVASMGERLKRLPDAAAESAGGLLTFGSSAGQINTDGAGRPDVNVERFLDGTPNALISGRIDVDVGDITGTSVIALAQFDGAAIDSTVLAANAIGSSQIAASAIGVSEAPNLDAAISTRATPAQVATEVSDALRVDTVTLPGQVAPPLTPTFEEMVSWLYKVLRNRKDQTSTLWQLYADNETTVDAKATVSDASSTATKQEIVSGP